MGQHDSNLGLLAHGLTFEVSWHWGSVGLDVVGAVSTAELAKMKELVRHGDPVGAAKRLAKVISAPVVPPACYDRLGEQLLQLLG